MFKKTVFGLLLLLSSALCMAASLNINKATAEQLAETMVGVGPAKAEAIVKDREQHGKFISLDEMVRVKGIGLATVEKNREKITIE